MPIALLALLSFFLLVLGVITFKSNTKSQTNRYFFGFILCTIIWIVSNYISNNTSNEAWALWSNRAIFIASTPLLWFLYLFSLAYPSQKISVKREYLLTIGWMLTLDVMILSFTPYLVEGVTIFVDHSDITFGILFPFYLAHVVSCFSLFLYTIIKKLKKSTGLERIKVQYLLLGLTLSAAGVFITNLILPVVFNDFSLSNVGPAFLLFLVGFSSFSIIKHRLFGLNYLITSFVKYLILALLLYIGFYLAYFFELSLWKSVLSKESLVAGGVIAFAYVLFFVIVNEKLSSLIEKRWKFAGADLYSVNKKFVNDISSELNVDKINDSIQKAVSATLYPEFTSVVLISPENNEILHQACSAERCFTIGQFNQIDTWVKKQGLVDRIIVTDELFYQQSSANISVDVQRLIGFLKEQNIGLMAQLHLNGNFTGFIFVGNRESLKAYTSQEIEFIEYLITNASIALGRSLLYEKSVKFAKVLEEKVAEATKELQEKYQMEKDMVGIMGHELRTPLTVAKGNIELLASKVNKINDDELREAFVAKLEKIQESVRKEADLIETMVSTAHVDSGRFNLQITQGVKIEEAIEYAVLANRRTAEQKGLYLKYIKPDFVIPLLVSDQIRVQEIVNNVVSNAVKYTKTGGVTITISLDELELAILITDTGIGIPHDEVSKLGQKFHRVGQYLDDEKQIVRAGGTGLGLYVVKGLLGALKGRWIIDSEVNKGTTFRIYLPLENKFSDVIEEAKPVDDDLDMFVKLGLKK